MRVVADPGQLTRADPFAVSTAMIAVSRRWANERPWQVLARGIWSLLKRSMANFATADVDGLVRIVKRKLKKIQYRPHLIDGCLAATGLTLEPW